MEKVMESHGISKAAKSTNPETMFNVERAYKKALSSTLLASILKSRVRVTVVKEKSSANFSS